MSPHEQLLSDMKEHLNESEAYAAYSANVARRYRKRDLISKWVVAAAASGPFMNWLSSTSETTYSWVLVTMPLLAIGLPLLNYSAKIELASSLHGHYISVIPQLKKLWRRLCSNASPNDEQLTDWRNEICDLETRLAEIRRLKQEMPDIKSLAKKADTIAKKYTIPPFTLADEKNNAIENEERAHDIDAYVSYDAPHAG
ncbi:MAG: hypothetical protein D3924_13385 [Candidatus Electrothrix sp. AR4]|nr:hypothetical protein [Candidatus Electrothrix sp. AR4]